LLEFVSGRLLLPLHELARRRATLRYLKELRRSQALDEASLAALRRKKLARLLEHCRREVPYYTRLLEGALLEECDEGRLSGLLPVLERETIRAHRDELVADSYRGRLIRYNTGGSTGEPLVFYTDAAKEARHNAYKLRCREWFGVAPGSRQVDFWGSPIELDKLSRFRILKDRLVLNHVVLSAFNLTEERLDGHVDFLRRFRPRLLYGYPTVLFRVADHIARRGIELGSYRPSLVACTSEMLFDHHRARIAETFRCPVANEYGSRDGGLIAHECKRGSLHIAAEHVMVEVDRPDESGVGDLLITNLDGFAMPLLRYRVGDRGRLGESCGCGLPLPVLESVEGRSNDFVVGAGGKLIHSLAPVYVLREIDKIRQFKLTQREDLGLELQIVERGAFDPAEVAELQRRLRKVFGFDVDVDVRFVDTIAPEASGKYRWVISRARGISP
jgi:phenylacetate-CoA ligase